MRSVSILKHLKVVIADMVDENGNIRAIPISGTGKRGLTNNRIKFIADLIRLVRDTNIINEETRIYIFNKSISIRGVNELLNKNIIDEDKKYKVNTTISKIQYNKTKLTKIFGESMFRDILSNSIDISIYERVLSEQYAKYSNTDEMRENIVLNIPNNCITTEVSDEEFEEFIKIIAPYTKNHIEYIENNISNRLYGYFNYLISMPKLEGVDGSRRDILKKLLG